MSTHSLYLQVAFPSIKQKLIGISSCFMPQSTSYIASTTMKHPTRRCLHFSSATRWHHLQAAAYFSDESGRHLDSYIQFLWFLSASALVSFEVLSSLYASDQFNTYHCCKWKWKRKFIRILYKPVETETCS